MMNNKNVLAFAVAATLGGASTAADAATFAVSLNGVSSFYALLNGEPLPGNLTSSTATFIYDDATDLLMQTGGTLNVLFALPSIPVQTLWRHLVTGLVIGNGAAASASTYVCAEGNWGVNASINFCGNYEFGQNLVKESTISYGPGTAFARTIGGDDMATGPQQSILDLNGMTTSSWDGTTLVLSNGVPSDTPTPGFQWTLSTVPIPPAVWLFGSALGVMGVMRRKAV